MKGITMLRLIVTVALLSMLLVACGGGDDDDGESASTPESTSPAVQSVAPTASDAPAAPEVVVGKYRQVQSGDDHWYIAGEVTNQGESDVFDTSVVVTMRDQSGAILYSETAHVQAIIRAGATVGWDLINVQVDPETAATIDLVAQADPFEAFYQTLYTDELSVSNLNWTESAITGDVTNTSDAPVEKASIIVIGYDDAGEVIGSDWSYVQIERLEPGQSSPFSFGYLTPFKGEIPAELSATVHGFKVD